MPFCIRGSWRFIAAASRSGRATLVEPGPDTPGRCRADAAGTRRTPVPVRSAKIASCSGRFAMRKKRSGFAYGSMPSTLTWPSPDRILARGGSSIAVYFPAPFGPINDYAALDVERDRVQRHKKKEKITSSRRRAPAATSMTGVVTSDTSTARRRTRREREASRRQHDDIELCRRADPSGTSVRRSGAVTVPMRARLDACPALVDVAPRIAPIVHRVENEHDRRRWPEHRTPHHRRERQHERDRPERIEGTRAEDGEGRDPRPPREARRRTERHALGPYHETRQKRSSSATKNVAAVICRRG